jgi:hypothetical protein
MLKDTDGTLAVREQTDDATELPSTFPNLP